MNRKTKFRVLAMLVLLGSGLLSGCGEEVGAPPGSTLVIDPADASYGNGVGIDGACPWFTFPPVEYQIVDIFIKVLGADGKAIPGVDVMVTLPFTSSGSVPIQVMWLFDDAIGDKNGTIMDALGNLQANELVSDSGFPTAYATDTGDIGVRHLWLVMQFDADCAYFGDILVESGPQSASMEIEYNQ